MAILHLSLEHESSLPQILGSRTRMTVRNAGDGEAVAPNHVYIIPADRTLSISGRILQLSEREAAPGRFRPINRFFRSLAEQLEEKAVGILLSGTGCDGIEGLGAIQEAGGLTFVQSAEFPEMPLNAPRTGKVDFVLAPEKIGAQLGHLMEHPHLRKRPPEVPAWEQIQSLLRTTGIDFSRYKPNTIGRRAAGWPSTGSRSSTPMSPSCRNTPRRSRPFARTCWSRSPSSSGTKRSSRRWRRSSRRSSRTW